MPMQQNLPVSQSLVITAAGTYTLQPWQTTVFVSLAAAGAVNINLPATAPPDGTEYAVFDAGGTATAAAPITIAASSGFTLASYNSNNVISVTGGAITLRYAAALTKYGVVA